MKTRKTKTESYHQKYLKYQRWILTPSYIEQEIKGQRLMNKLEKELDKL